MLIHNTKDLRQALRMGSYTSIGCYPIFFATSDGEAMHPKCVRENYRQVSSAIRHNETYDSWHVFGCDINYEDASMYCAHCNERIESAYAEDGETEEDSDHA